MKKVIDDNTSRHVQPATLAQDEKPWMIASLARGLQILELIAQRQCGCRAKWVSHVSGIKLSTCYHLLNTLVYAGYLEKDKQLQEYTLTDKVARLNNLFQSQRHIPQNIKVLAQALVHSAGETVYVATWERDEVIISYIAEAPTRQRNRPCFNVSTSNPALVSSTSVYRERIDAWIKRVAKEPGTGFVAADFETHVRDEYSTFGWLLEGMLTRAGFLIETATYPSAEYAEYICRKR